MLEVNHPVRLRIGPNGVGILTLSQTAILPFEHDSPYYYSLFQAVCNHNAAQLDQDLQDSRDLFQRSFGNLVYDHGNLAAILNRLARQSVQCYNENLAGNLGRAVCRMIELEMKVNMNVNETRDTLVKLARHVYKRLCRLNTVWPHSVPQTPQRTAICQTAFNRFRIVFIHLCPVNERQQFTFGNAADPNTGFHGYDNQIRIHPNQYLGIFFQASRYIEHIKNRVNAGVFRRVQHPMDHVPHPYLLHLFRTRLSWGREGRPYPVGFQGKLIKKIKMLIDEFQDMAGLENVDHRNLQHPLRQRMMDRIMEVMGRNFNRPDAYFDVRPRNAILSNVDVAYIQRFIIKTSVQIRQGNFFPSLRVTVGNTKMFHIVPQSSFTRSHIPIDRGTFHSFLLHSGFRRLGLPTYDEFMQNDLLAAQWYWRIFDFHQRIKFQDFVHFYPGAAPQNKRFEFLIDTDGTAFSAHFSKPSMDQGVPLTPRDVRNFRGHTSVWYVDPGQKNCFTAMEGRPIVNMAPAPLPLVPAPVAPVPLPLVPAPVANPPLGPLLPLPVVFQPVLVNPAPVLVNPPALVNPVNPPVAVNRPALYLNLNPPPVHLLINTVSNFLGTFACCESASCACSTTSCTSID